MSDLTFLFLVALMIFIYSCAKIVLRYLKESKIMSTGSSSNAITELYLKEAEASSQKRQAFLMSMAGALSGAGLGLIIGFVIKVCCKTDNAAFIISGCIIMLGGAGMLLGNIINRKLNERK